MGVRILVQIGWLLNVYKLWQIQSGDSEGRYLVKWVAGTVWVIAWIPLSTLFFQYHPHIDAFLQPLMLIADLLPDAERSVEAKAYLWSGAHLRLTVSPALTFWVGLVLALVITPNRNSKKD